MKESNIIKTIKAIIETTRVFTIKYKKLQEEYKIVINKLYQNIYEVTGVEDNVKLFLTKENKYILRMEIK